MEESIAYHLGDVDPFPTGGIKGQPTVNHGELQQVPESSSDRRSWGVCVPLHHGQWKLSSSAACGSEKLLPGARLPGLGSGEQLTR